MYAVRTENPNIWILSEKEIKIIIIIIITLSTQVAVMSVSSLLKGISWSQRLSNLVRHSFCEHIG